MTPEPAQPAEAWLNDPASLESGEPAQPAESPEASSAVVGVARCDIARGSTITEVMIGDSHDGTVEAFARRVLSGEYDWPLTFAASTARPTERGAVEVTPGQYDAAVDALNLAQEDEDADTRVQVDAVIEALGVKRPSAEAVLCRMLGQPYLPATDQAAEVERLSSEEAWNILLNVDDRTSPEEYPDMCLITRDELMDFMSRPALQNGGE